MKICQEDRNVCYLPNKNIWAFNVSKIALSEIYCLYERIKDIILNVKYDTLSNQGNFILKIEKGKILLCSGNYAVATQVAATLNIQPEDINLNGEKIGKFHRVHQK